MNEGNHEDEPVSRNGSSSSKAESIVNLVESEEDEQRVIVVDLSDDKEDAHKLVQEEFSGNWSEIMDDSSIESLFQEPLSHCNSANEYLPLPLPMRHLFENNKCFLERKFGVGIIIQNNNLQNQLFIYNGDPTVIAVAKLELQQIVENPHILLDELRTLQLQKIHIFVDESNIILGANNIFLGHFIDNNNVSRPMKRPINDSIHFNPSNLINIISNKRNIVEKVLFGSQKKNTPEPLLWQQWRNMGFTVHTQIRENKESFLDDALVGMILSTVGKFSFQTDNSKSNNSSNNSKRTLVLLTGDGNDNHQRASFVEAVHLALRQGWQVEIWCWRATVSQNYLNMQKEYAYSGFLSVHYLDEFRGSFTTHGDNSHDSGLYSNRSNNIKKPRNDNFSNSNNHNHNYDSKNHHNIHNHNNNNSNNNHNNSSDNNNSNRKFRRRSRWRQLRDKKAN